MTRVWLPDRVTPERASVLIGERVPGFRECRSWLELQGECARRGVELLPARDERQREDEP